MKIKNYVDKMIEVQGLEKTTEILTNMLNISNRTTGINFYSDQDWVISTSANMAVYNVPRKEGHRTKGNRSRRETNTKNFYKSCLNYLKNNP